MVCATYITGTLPGQPGQPGGQQPVAGQPASSQASGVGLVLGLMFAGAIGLMLFGNRR